MYGAGCTHPLRKGAPLVFKGDVPGVRESDLEVTVTGNRLTIFGRREAEKHGVLTVVVPKQVAATPKEVQVSAGAGTGTSASAGAGAGEKGKAKA